MPLPIHGVMARSCLNPMARPAGNSKSPRIPEWRTLGVGVASNGNTTQRFSKTVISLNTWYYVAGVYNAAAQTLDVYVNGVLDNGVLGDIVPASFTVSACQCTGRKAGSGI